MARKRKKSTSVRRRRRGVGSVNIQSSIMDAAFVLGGFAAAGYINKLALSGRSNTVQAIAPIAAGIILPTFLKSDAGKKIGTGMVVFGAGKFLQNVGLAGIGNDGIDVPISIGDDGQLSIVAGDDDLYAMAGNDDLYAMAGDDMADSMTDDAVSGDLAIIAGLPA